MTCVSAVTRLALRDCHERQLTLNVAYLSRGGIDAGNQLASRCIEILFTSSPGPPLNASEKKSF